VESVTDDEASRFYDYPARERRFRDALAAFPGHRLTAMRVQLLHGELNQAYLALDDRTLSIQGDIGGELLKVVDASVLPEIGVVDKDVRIWQPPQVVRFLGRVIVAARAVGEAWNGHGVELAFEGAPTETILITSVEAPENKRDIHDMLRIAFPSYLTEVFPEAADA